MGLQACLWVVSGMVLTAVLGCPVEVSAQQAYSLVINNGRVIDPETGLDGVRHLGIRGDSIVTIASEPLAASRVIDATDLIVAPGFIDLHTHSPTPLGQYYQAFDGVTSALELEAGYYPVGEYGGGISDTPLLNFGASAGHVMARILEKNGLQMSGAVEPPSPRGVKGWWTAIRYMFTDADTALAPSFREQASAKELANLRTMLEQSLDQGALGIGLPLDYFSAAIQATEMQMIFSVAADRDAPVFVHIRRGIDGDPTGLREVIKLAKTHGAAVHICHVTHSAMSELELFLGEIRKARQDGVDITTEVLPYNAGSAAIGSAVFGRNWREIFNIDYANVQWAATGEWLTQESFLEYRRSSPDGVVIHHYLQEPWTRRALVEPGVIVVSDLIAMTSRDKKVAPHNGAFSKVLGRYVREEQLLDWVTALEKMTLLPARRLEEFAPVFGNKGRLQVGKDADITIFNPRTILDRASYEDPYQEAAGIEYVIVNGVPIIQQGELVAETYPGRRLLSTDK